MFHANTWHLLNRFVKDFFKLTPLNPFTDEQLNLLGIVPKEVCHFTSINQSINMFIAQDS